MENGLGNYIKNERIKKNISIRELEKNTDITRANLSRIENGLIKKPNIDTLLKIGKALNLSIKKLGELANYNENEIKQKIIKNYFDRVNLFNEQILLSNLGDIESYEKYMFKYKDITYIDVKKVLNGYKNKELNEKETIVLITASQIDYNDDKITYPSKNQDIKIDIL